MDTRLDQDNAVQPDGTAPMRVQRAVNRPALRAWVTELRTTQQTQEQDGYLGRLLPDGTMTACCLLVANLTAQRYADVPLMLSVQGGVVQAFMDPTRPDRDTIATLTPDAAEWFFGKAHEPSELDTNPNVAMGLRATVANDTNRWSFVQIADSIEAYYRLTEPDHLFAPMADEPANDNDDDEAVD